MLRCAVDEKESNAKQRKALKSNATGSNTTDTAQCNSMY